jgi:hypothetical protein
MKRFCCTLLFCTVLVAPCLAQYRFKIVDFPGAAQTNVIAVNDGRQYVGISVDATGNDHAIYFSGKKLSLLDPSGVVGANFSFALSLNNRGDIVGGYVDAAGVSHGFLYNGGKVSTLDFPGAASTQAFGVNDRREIIGIYFDSASNLHAFELKNSTYKTIDLSGALQTVPFSINDFSEIVGEDVDVAGTIGHGYLALKNGKFTTYDAPGAPPNSTFFISINNLNKILGAWVDANNLNHNFLLTNGKSRIFDVPKSFKATQVSVQTLNDLSDVVGYFTDAQGIQHGFLAFRRISGHSQQ